MQIRNKYRISLLIVLVMSMSVITAITSPVMGVTIVKMGDNNAIDKSILAIREDVPNPSILEYNSLEFSLKISHCFGPVIWIGHGNDQGIETENFQMSWVDFASNIEKTPAKDVVLSCDSKNLLKQTDLEETDVFTFEESIDAVIGGLFTSYIITKSQTIIDKLLVRAINIVSGTVQKEELVVLIDDGGGAAPPPTPPTPTVTYIVRNPFGPSGGWGIVETVWNCGNLAMVVIGALLTFSSIWIVAKVAEVISAAGLSFFSACANFFAVLFNHMSSVAMIGSAFLAFLPAIVNFICTKLIPKIAWYLAAAAIADVTAQAAAVAATAGTALALKVLQIISIVLTVVWWVIGSISDITDVDDICNMPAWMFGG
ncbi:MAG: hypothetical protein ACTSU7_15160 [Candidatus Heimdallarchaeaceae archaeon]